MEDGTGYWIPRSGVSRAELRDATIVVVEIAGILQGISKVIEFGEGGIPKFWKRIYGKNFKLDELELVDCRKSGSEK